MMFLYLVPTGMNDPEQPEWGSWAGRYGPREDLPGYPYFWANREDAWDGTTHRENTLRRWAAALQNDFRARLDWCVAAPKDANHPPVVRLRGERLRRVKSGARVVLDARGTRDPDGDRLRYAWEFTPEPGTYRGAPPVLDGADTPRAAFVAPPVDAPRTLHVLLSVTDTGEPPLTRYARVVVTVEPSA